MYGKKRLIEFVLIVLLVLLLSAFRTMTARADDATPQPTVTPAVTQEADDSSTGRTPVAPMDTPVPTHPVVMPKAHTSIARPAPMQAPKGPAPASTVLLSSQLSQGTRLVLVSDQVPAVPLGSAEAANIIKTGDPIWCPTGVAPKANTGGCTASFSLINGDLQAAMTGKMTSGIIWIEDNYSEDAAVTLNSSTIDNTTVNYALTLQGGWNGNEGSKTISGSSTFNYPLTINWNANVSLNDITVTGILTSDAALTVTTKKNITLTGVNVNTNTGPGAVLDNCLISGTNCTGTGTVTVTSSQFNDNTGGHGLEVDSNGTLNISSVTANTNSGDGADLINNNAASAKSVILASGPFEFNGNGASGLEVYSKGNIALNNVTADTNRGDGVAIYDFFATSNMNVTLAGGPYEFNDNGNDGLDIVSNGAIALKDVNALGNSSDGAELINTTPASTDQGITLTGSNVFSENGSRALLAISNGAISINNLVANANGWGTFLDNSSATSAQPVTLTGSSNQFNSNFMGLYIESKGNITLNSISASFNRGDPGGSRASGAELDNCLYDSVNDQCTGTGNVILTGTNSFEDNYRTGLRILSNGTITVNNLSADRNGYDYITPANSFGDGAEIYNDQATTSKSITLTGTNSFSDNYNYGLYIRSQGPISVSNVTANHNETGDGAYLNDSSLGAVGSLTVSGINNFGDNGLDGLEVYSNGAISLNSLDAENNSGFGGQIDNSTALTPQSVNLTGTNLFNSNSYGAGLQVISEGGITLNKVQASSNHGNGVYIDNSGASTPQNVTLNGTNEFSNNGGDGLDVYSNGAISVSNLVADQNGSYGTRLDNSGASKPQIVTLNGFNKFSDNSNIGLIVYSNGTISVNNLEANNNGNIGAWLINNNNISSNITLNGSNEFSNNSGDGLDVYSNGAISVSNLVADQNGSYGTHLDNSGASKAQNVTLNGSNEFSNNNKDGLIVYSNGTISVNNLEANNNASIGAWLINNNDMSSNVTLIGFNEFSNNGGDGLDVYSNGAISVSNLVADQNGSYGTHLDNSGASKAQNVTLNGSNEFSNNNKDGLIVYSNGTISVNNLEAHNNGDIGALLINNNDLSSNITLIGSTEIYSNVGDGLDVNSNGTITISNLVKACGNGGNGGVLSNITGSAKYVSVIGNNNTLGFSGNYLDGLDIISLGAISVSNLVADDNGGFGADFNNIGATTPQFVRLIGTNSLNGNGAVSSMQTNGLEIQTLGSVTIANLTASGNRGAGAHINNQFIFNNPQNVTLTGSNVMNSNGDSGLVVTTYGMIAGNNLTANDNGWNPSTYGWGVFLDACGYTGFSSCTSTLAESITLTGTNIFNGNDQNGLWATSRGPILVNNLTASGNYAASGAWLNNQLGSGSNGGITLTGSNTFKNNAISGLRAQSQGAISLNNLTADDNAVDGVDLNTYGLTAAQNVTITGSSTFLNNGDPVGHTGDGLIVSADGNITINNATANGNASLGTALDNSKGSGTITLTSTNAFSNNYSDGLDFNSQKAVTVNGVTANKNGGIGVNGITAGTITVLGGSMTGNTLYGWQFSANPTVTLKGVFAYGNNGGVQPENNLLAGNLIIVRTYP